MGPLVYWYLLCAAVWFLLARVIGWDVVGLGVAIGLAVLMTLSAAVDELSGLRDRRDDR